MSLFKELKNTGILMVFLMTVSVYAQENTIQKSDLKVLYVGQHPDQPEGYTYGGNRNVMDEHKKWRADDFMELLNQYFSDVTLVYGHEYVESISDNFDVTIFDALTPVIREKEVTYNQELGYKIISRRADYLSDDYEAATILIAGVSAPIMANKKTKIKWSCHCLENHAFGFDENHTLLNNPYKVIALKEKVPTPPSFFHYYIGRDLEESMQMLRMQKTNTPEGYSPGFVSYAGFGDSPDAEEISHGPCIKTMSTIAIGRHGNFFQWGYRASPKYMTEAAKLMFINSVHYMAKFKGEKPYVFRVADARESAMDWPYKISDKGFNHQLRRVQKINNRIDAAKAQLLAGIENKYSGRYAKRKYIIPDRTSSFKYIPEELIKEYADDWNAYIQYFEKNYGYIIPNTGSQKFIVDIDAQSLGIANNDIKLLNTCVTMLLNKDQTELAQRLLMRYTEQSFEKAKDWKKWFRSNKDKLFFTETGGYKFLVNKNN